MKLVTFVGEGQPPRIGALLDDERTISDLTATGSPWSVDMLALMDGGEASRPVYYKPNCFSVIGTDQDIVRPSYSRFLDYELEFGVFLGKRGKDETRQPGEFFASGTVGGGCSLEHGRWLRDGDILELEAEGLGRLRNRTVLPKPEPAIVASLAALTGD